MTSRSCLYSTAVSWGIRLLAICALWTLTLGTTRASQYDPAKLDSVDQRVVQLITKRAAAQPTIEAQLREIGVGIDAHLLPRKFAIVCGLLHEAHELARRHDNRQKGLDLFTGFVEAYDFDAFTNQQRTHIAYLTARWEAFDGFINQAEANLLSVLARDSQDISLYTRTSAHYMAAYCSYYTDQLERCAMHARKSAQGFHEMGDMLGALEGYDGASTTYFKMGQVDSALHFARKGLALSSYVQPIQRFNLYLNYAEALMVNGQADSAFYYANRANDLAEASGRTSALARAELCLANLNNNYRKPQTAIRHYENASQHFTEADEFYHLADVLDSLSALYAYTGAYARAYEQGMRGFKLRDSLRQDRVKKDNDRLVAEAERDALSKKLRESEDERAMAQVVIAKRNTERVTWGSVCLTLILLGTFLYYRTKTRKKLNAKLRGEVESRTADLRQRSEQLELQAARLRESNAELERFAYIASHDLKTPLRNVTSFIGLIERRLPAESKALVAEYLEIALENARQMHELVTDVLEFSRLNSNINELSEPIDVNTVVNEVRTGMQAELDERNAVINLVGGQEKLVLPKGSLEQILSNLIGNAIKYNTSPRPEAKVVTVDMGERIRISVSDNGIGIDPEYHDRIFEVFRRLHTSDEFAGTGVGLAACRKVILRLGGDIRVESKAGLGSTFIVDLPKDARVGDQSPTATAEHQATAVEQ